MRRQGHTGGTNVIGKLRSVDSWRRRVLNRVGDSAKIGGVNQGGAVRVSKILQAILVVSLAAGCAYLVSCGSKSPSTSTGQNSSEPAVSKYERNDKKDRVIVFVHGIFGSA